MRNTDPNKVIVPITFDKDDYLQTQQLARKLNLDLVGLLAKALRLFMLIQGRRLILKEKGNDIDMWEIKDYREKDKLVPKVA